MANSKLIRIDNKFKIFLDRRKIHPSETYQEILKRLLKKGGINA